MSRQCLQVWRDARPRSTLLNTLNTKSSHLIFFRHRQQCQHLFVNICQPSILNDWELGCCHWRNLQLCVALPGAHESHSATLRLQCIPQCSLLSCNAINVIPRSSLFAMTCHDCPCLVTRTALELQSVHLGLLSKADYCTILYSAHEYIEQLYITIYIVYEIIWTTWKAHAVVFLWYFDPQRTSCTSEGYLGYKWLQSVVPANSGRGLTSHTRNCTYVESVFGSFDAFERFRTLSEGASKNNTC